MPPLQYWFTGGALAAGLALFATVVTLGFAWYRAADTEMNSAIAKSEKSAESKKFIEVREQLGLFLAEGIELLRLTRNEATPAPTEAAEAWNMRVISYLESALGSSFAHRFIDASGLPMGITSLQSEAHRKLEGGLKVRTARLQQFLSELSPTHIRVK